MQTRLSERALELLAVPDDQPCFLLDIGCGSGLSGEVLSDNGHYWIGMDISKAMLDVAYERETEGDLLLSDMGNGIPFRAGTFDGAIRYENKAFRLGIFIIFFIYIFKRFFPLIV